MLAPPLEMRVRLASHLTSAAQARSLISTALRGWGRGDLINDVQLVASELVTNAVLHAAGSEVEVVLRLTDRAVRVEVHDTSPRPPARRPSTADDTTGRGLALVASLAASWGVERSDDGKRVWAEVG